jgi:predicted NBD/HSP70 family sugar kinase
MKSIFISIQRKVYDVTISGNALVMRDININLVRKTLRMKQQATKHQIAEATGLSTVTVGTVLQKLMQENIAFESGLVPSAGGRPAQQFRFNADHAHVLILFMHEQAGLDVLHLRVANLFGAILHQRDLPLTDINLHSFEPYIDAALQAYPSIQAIGFGLPGVEHNGKIVLADYPALVGTDFKAHYQQRYHLPIIIENDVNAASAGYHTRIGLAVEATSIYLYFPQKYPPGGGIYLNGKLYKGYNHYAGEVASMPLGIDWRDPALYTTPDRITDAIARLIIAVSSLLNPQSIILFGSFLTDDHLTRIRQQYLRYPSANAVPLLELTHDFTLDYQNGMIEQALALLEPQISISI